MERGELSGSLPATLGNLANLEKLDLDYNNLWGTLPSTFVHLANLKLIDLNNNDLSGSIDVLAGLSNLFFIQLQSNYFSGTVSEAFGSLSQLREYLFAFVCDLFK
jgi:Leucine-rich repeat (LRR) protein